MAKPLYDIPYLEKLQVLLAALKQRSLELLEIKKGDVIADIGCGTGADAAAIAKMGAKVYGFDHNPEMITASKQQKAEGLNIEFIQSDAANIPLPSGSVDKILFDRVFQHLDDYNAVLQEAYRILKPGGQFQIIDPDHFSFTLFLADIELERKLLDNISYKRIPNSYRVRQIPQFLEKNGFKTQLTEIHNYLVKDYNLATSIIRFEKVVNEEYAEGNIREEELNNWYSLKAQSSESFNFSMNMMMFSAIKNA